MFEFKQYFIQFKNEKDFEEVSNWVFTPGDVIDISFPEMSIHFKDDETLETWYGCILWNHIKDENLIIHKD